jgi:tyrosyl-tRNA synthetase
MTLLEIKNEIAEATPEKISVLAEKFERQVEKLMEFHKAYIHFYDEYCTDISYIIASRNAGNKADLLYFVETVLHIGERLQNEVQ